MAKIISSNQTDTYQLDPETEAAKLIADQIEESKKEDLSIDTDERQVTQIDTNNGEGAKIKVTEYLSAGKGYLDVGKGVKNITSGVKNVSSALYKMVP
jgi:hypothetical protein